MVFTTRKSFSFIIFLIFSTFVSLSLMIINIENHKFMEAVIALIMCFILLSFLFNNKIVLQSYFIRVYFGIFLLTIKYKDIKVLYKTDNHLLSLSSSTHKVGIKTNNLKTKFFDIFVSPMDQDDFIYEVKNRI